MKEVIIYCKNTDRRVTYPMGITLGEIALDQNIQLKTPVCGALVNNKLKELSFSIVKSKNVEFVDMIHPDGRRMYIRSLLFVFYAAVNELYPEAKMSIEHGISNGYYAEMKGLGRDLTETDIFAIDQAMKEIIRKDYPFEKLGLPTEEAVAMIRVQGLESKANLFEQQGTLYSFLYRMNGLVNYFYGHLLPSAGYITNFGLELYYEGLLLKVPHPDDYKTLQDSLRQNKLFSIYQEHKDWAEILQVATISDLNRFILNGKAGDIIKISEALHEKKIAEIANRISQSRDTVKLVLVAGPSSSGKTTFSKRLGVQLAVNGLWPLQISLDDYFVDREHTPHDENGEYDFEALHAIDVSFFNAQLLDLLDGKRVNVPKFNFLTGQRYFDGHYLELKPGHVLIIEGIHGLNPDLLPVIDPSLTYKIFISALTQVSVDEHTHISTSDNRLIRRMIRDSKYRGYPAHETIKRWPLVRKGEERNIFPFQENADIMFNSATLYELAVLKKYAEPLLLSVTENKDEYSESTRLLKFLSYFKPMDDSEIPPTSLLREFLGGSSFTY
ncbi:uridine kinase [Bacteroidales bacterium 6E]|nr:uridine kinase [Bacteroidales bacterium 6E]